MAGWRRSQARPASIGEHHEAPERAQGNNPFLRETCLARPVKQLGLFLRIHFAIMFPVKRQQGMWAQAFLFGPEHARGTTGTPAPAAVASSARADIGARLRQGPDDKEERMGEDRKVAVPIGGMTCQHCADSVTKALSGLAGVSGVSVDLRKGMATVTGNGIDFAAIKSTVEDMGFDAGVPC